MAEFLHIHPVDPQKRLLKQAASIIAGGGLVAYPTDSSYALGCHLGDKNALDRIRAIRQANRDHHFTLVARDLSHISEYAKIDNQQYRVIKNSTPGAFTFILPAKRKVPRRIMHQRRKTIGLRIPDNKIVQGLLDVLVEPILSSTLILPGKELPLGDPQNIYDTLQHQVDLVIDGGQCGYEPTTVIDWHADAPKIIRQGKGEALFI